MVLNVKNELMAIKIILEPPCISVTDDVKQCSCPASKTLIQDIIKIALEDYLSKKKPLPVRIFKEEHSTMMMYVLRNQRELL